MLLSSFKPSCIWHGYLNDLARLTAHRGRSRLAFAVGQKVSQYLKQADSTPFKRPRLLTRLSNSSQASPETEPTSGQYLKTLLLAFFASQKRSLFAAKCLVQTVLELYHQSVSLDDVQLELKLAGLREERQISTLDESVQAKARWIQGVEQEMLLTWVALIQLTIKELDTKETGKGSEESGGESSGTALGLRRFVKEMLASGYDLQRLQLQQQMAEDEKGRSPPSVQLMQENARLVILTREVVAASPSAESEPLFPKETELLGQGRRAAAVRSLLAFIGAAQGSMFAVDAFLDEVLFCYRQGWTAQQVADELSQEEFATGQTLFPVATSQGSGSVSASIYAQWLSVVFMSLAQQGVPHAASKDALGWGWADFADAAEDKAPEAYRLAQFVSQTLQRQAEMDGAARLESETAEAVRKLAAEAQPAKEGDSRSFVVIEDDSLRESSSTMALLAQLIDLIERTRKLVWNLTKESS